MKAVIQRLLSTHGGIGFVTAALLGLSVAVPLAFAALSPSEASGPQERVAPAAQAKVAVLIGFVEQPGRAEEAVVRGLGGDIKYTYHLVPAIAASVPPDAVDALRRNPRVTNVDPDLEIRAIDGELDNTWGVKRIGAGTVHDGGNRGANVKVAIIDSGIDYNHPDLALNYAGGYDFVNGDADPMDDDGHGTHVAGTVAARDDNAGVVGVAPEARLYGLKVLNASGSGAFSDVIAALQWAVDNGIQVTNNSYGQKGNPGGTVEAAFANSYVAGVLHVAAAGNSGNCSGMGNSVEYPGRYDSVIAVAATNSSDGSPCFSSVGPAVELAAPGVDVNSTLMGGGYGTKTGTSMASPHVAGTAALVIASGITNCNAINGVADEVRERMDLTADDLGLAGRDTWYGYGLVDAVGAVTPEACAAPPPPPPPPGGFTLSATGYKVKGLQKADLTWSGSSNNVDVYRNGTVIAPNEANDGAYTDNIDQKGGGSYTYKVCQTGGTSTCSNEATVTF